MSSVLWSTIPVDVWAALSTQEFVLGDDGLTVYYAQGGELTLTGASRPTLVGDGPIADGSGNWIIVPTWIPDHDYVQDNVDWAGPQDFVQSTTPNGLAFHDGDSAGGHSGTEEPAWVAGPDIEDPIPGPDPDLVGAALLDIYAPQPDGSLEFVGTIDDWIDCVTRKELNAWGHGTLVINRYSANATPAMIAQGNIVAVRYPQIWDQPPFAWFMENGDFTLISSKEKGGEDIAIDGRGVGAYWERCIWLDDTVATTPAAGWWPDCLDPPPDSARGAVKVAAGTYLRYPVDPTAAPAPRSSVYSPTPTSRGIITGDPDSFVTTGFCAYFDTRKTFGWPGANPDGSSNQRFLVRLTVVDGDGADVGDYFHPHQPGVVEYMRSTGTPDTPGLTDTLIPLDTIGGGLPGGVLYKMSQLALDPDRWIHPMALLAVDFDADTDSDGQPFASSNALHGMTAQIGETYSSTIEKLVGATGPDVDVTFDGSAITTHAYNLYGRDLTGDDFGDGVVRFVHGVNVTSELSRVWPGPSIVPTGALVGGDGSTYARALLDDADSRVPREIFVSGSGADADALEAVGGSALTAGLSGQESIPLDILTGNDPSVGRYLPGPPGSSGHFWVGDTVRLLTGTGELDFDETDERVYAITIAMTKAPSADKPEFAVTVELSATIDFIDSVSTPPQPAIASAYGYSAVSNATATTTPTLTHVQIGAGQIAIFGWTYQADVDEGGDGLAEGHIEVTTVDGDDLDVVRQQPTQVSIPAEAAGFNSSALIAGGGHALGPGGTYQFELVVDHGTGRGGHLWVIVLPTGEAEYYEGA